MPNKALTSATDIEEEAVGILRGGEASATIKANFLEDLGPEDGTSGLSILSLRAFSFSTDLVVDDGNEEDEEPFLGLTGEENLFLRLFGKRAKGREGLALGQHGTNVPHRCPSLGT